jgi:hypothetical protein
MRMFTSTKVLLLFVLWCFRFKQFSFFVQPFSLQDRMEHRAM